MYEKKSLKFLDGLWSWDKGLFISSKFQRKLQNALQIAIIVLNKKMAIKYQNLELI